MPFKIWAVGEEVLAADFNTYVQTQVVSTFPNTAARDTWTSPPNGAMCITTDTYTTWVRVAGVWQSYQEIGYAQITANAGVSATTAAGANNILNMGNITFDGSPIIVEFHAPTVTTPAAAGASIFINLWDTNTDLGTFSQMVTPAAAAMGMPVTVRRRITPTAGVHNYNIRSWVSPSGSGTIFANVGNIGNPGPAYLRISRAT